MSYFCNVEEKRLPVATSVVFGHADVPHCDAPASPEEQAFYNALDTNDEYCELVRKEKREERDLRDSYRVFGLHAYDSLESGKTTVALSKYSLHQLKYIKQHRDALREIRSKKWKLYDEIKVQSSTPKTKSCYNCDFWTPENEKRCSNWVALYEAPFGTRDPPRALVIVEKGCELFRSSESTERKE